MAKKKGKDNVSERDTVGEIISAVEQRVAHDRERLSGYLNKLLAAVDLTEDPLTVVGSADAVAKIGDALTRQTHLAIEAAKILSRSVGKKGSFDAYDDIGLPFEDGPEKDGSN